MAKRKIDEQISYNFLFLIVASLFAAVTGWAVWDEVETRREYKNYQIDFFDLEHELAKARVAQETEKLKTNERYAELGAQQKAIMDDRAGKNRPQIDALQKKVQAEEFIAFDAAQQFTFSTSEKEESYYYFRFIAKHAYLADPENKDKKAAHDESKARYEKWTQQADQDRKKADAAQAKLDAIQKELDESMRTAQYTAIGKEIDVIRRPLDEATRALEASKEKSTVGMFGAPTEVIQQNLEDVGRVDRCQSCHLGVDRGGFETVARKEFQSHPMRRTLLGIHPPESFGCTSCHDGQGRATQKFFAHAPSPDENAHAFHQHYWEFPLLKGPHGGNGKEYMQSKCLGCHQDQWDLRSTLACELDVECPNTDQAPMVCAVPRPTKTDGAPLASVAKAQAAAAAAAAQADTPKPAKKYCVSVSSKDYGKYKEEQDANQRDKRRARMVKRGALANVQLAPTLSRGLRIIEEVGCFGCHPIAGYTNKPKPAPSLTTIAYKARPGWMIEWIKDPKAFRPNTRMPKFWPEIDNPSENPYPVDVEKLKAKRQQEATAMTAFLLRTSKASTRYSYALEKIPVAGNAERGKDLLATLGCVACHDVPIKKVKIDHKNRASHYDYGPDLSNVGAKTSKQWIYNWVKDPKRFSPTTRMPSLRLSRQEASDIAEFLAAQTAGKSYSAPSANLDDPSLIKKGGELVRHYGCFGCHQIEGFEKTPGIGADLTEFGLKRTERLDFGDYVIDHNTQTWDKWIWNKLKHPRVYTYDLVETRMPQFDLTDDEIIAVMTVLKGMRGQDDKAVQVLGRTLSATEKARERGRVQVRLYNCFGCHNIDNRTGDLVQLPQYRGPNAKYGPPPLTGQGDKAQPDWLFAFLKEPFLLRPLPKVRMPTFGFDDDTATDLVAMFSALDGASYPFRYYADVKPHDAVQYKVGKALFAATGCQKCHIVGAPTGGALPADVVAPNLVMTKERLRASWVAAWIADPNSLQRGTAMPGFWLGASNPLKLFMKNSPTTRAALAGISQHRMDAYLASKELQIEAVRDFLFVLTKSGGVPPKSTQTAQNP